MLHTLAASIEAGLSFDMEEINEISRRTPYLCKVSPATPNVHMEDVLKAGGISAILMELSKQNGLLKLDRPTVLGVTLGESISGAKNYNKDIIRSVDDPFSKEGGLAVLFGNIAPHGSIVKTAAVNKEMLVHEGPARIYESQDEAMKGILDGEVCAGDVCLLYTSPSPRDRQKSRMPSSA